jgi:hypothetical protein
MPSAVSEIASGAQFTRSSQEGVVADSQTRTFRIVLKSPGEYVDFQKECGIYIGDRHPSNTDIFCQSFDGRFDGESRMVLLATFNYATKASSSGSGGGDSSGGSPDIRPANWSTSVATYESPVRTWRKVVGGNAGNADAAENPVGDMYDGIVKLEPIVTISITQPQSTDPLSNVNAVGCINEKPVRVGPRTFPIASIMLRSIQSSPVVEAYGNRIFRGWSAAYEFLYKANPAYIYGADAFGAEALSEVDIGWDIAVPQTGFNVKAFAPPGGGSKDDYGQPLKHKSGKIETPLALPDNVTAGDKVRAMIKVFEYENGGASQVPSAQPVALNDDGTPRIYTADPKVLVYRYRVYKEYDFNTLGLRLF